MKKIIIAFHIGRGGSFYNQGHVKYIGENEIADFTSDLFIYPENFSDLKEKFNNYPNLTELLEQAVFMEDQGAIDRLKYWGYILNDREFFDETGRAIGLTESECNSGIGTIDIDGDYDTTYTKYISDCNESELILIDEYNGYKSFELQEYLNQYFAHENI